MAAFREPSVDTMNRGQELAGEIIPPAASALDDPKIIRRRVGHEITACLDGLRGDSDVFAALAVDQVEDYAILHGIRMAGDYFEKAAASALVRRQQRPDWNRGLNELAAVQVVEVVNG